MSVGGFVYFFNYSCTCGGSTLKYQYYYLASSFSPFISPHLHLYQFLVSHFPYVYIYIHIDLKCEKVDVCGLFVLVGEGLVEKVAYVYTCELHISEGL